MIMYYKSSDTQHGSNQDNITIQVHRLHKRVHKSFNPYKINKLHTYIIRISLMVMRANTEWSTSKLPYFRAVLRRYDINRWWVE